MTEKLSKAETTKQSLINAATSLFEEKGFEGATMRLVAQRAGVSVGNAYYYFSSKEELIQGYYANMNGTFREKIEPLLEKGGSLEDRLQSLMDAWLVHIKGNHQIAADLFRFAADPRSSMSPFSKESESTRLASLDTWTKVVEGSDKLKVSKELRARLPEMLWLFQMGVTMFWVYDNSKNQSRTRLLVKGATPLLARLISLSRVPILRGTVDEALELLDRLDPTKSSGR